MKKSSITSFKRTDVAYLLKKLYFVSIYFIPEEYETFVAATHYYLDFNSRIPLSSYAIDAYRDLFKLAISCRDYSSLKNDVRFNSIIDIYSHSNM